MIDKLYSRGGMLLLLSANLLIFAAASFAAQCLFPQNEKLFSFLSGIALTFNGALIQFVTSKRDEKDRQMDSATMPVKPSSGGDPA